jgi:hypothetical protein
VAAVVADDGSALLQRADVAPAALVLKVGSKNYDRKLSRRIF